MFISSAIEQYKRIVAIRLLCTARGLLLDAKSELSPPPGVTVIIPESAVGVPCGDKSLTDRIQRMTSIIQNEDSSTPSRIQVPALLSRFALGSCDGNRAHSIAGMSFEPLAIRHHTNIDR